MRFTWNFICASAVALAFVSAAALPARAAIILETASFTGLNPGSYPVYGNAVNGRFIGASFSVGQTTDITSVGVGLGRNNSGTIFAAIVALDPATGVPLATPADIGTQALAHTVFSVPSGIADVSTPLAVTLAAGDYGVVFGTGVFGASGVGAISSGNDNIGTPSLFQFLSVVGPDWITQFPDGIRIVVQGDAVPEPMSLALLVGGLVATAAVRRRTK